MATSKKKHTRARMSRPRATKPLARPMVGLFYLLTEASSQLAGEAKWRCDFDRFVADARRAKCVLALALASPCRRSSPSLKSKTIDSADRGRQRECASCGRGDVVDPPWDHPHDRRVAWRTSRRGERRRPLDAGIRGVVDVLSRTGDVVLFAESNEGLASPRARLRLQRPGLVIETRVNDAAVVARLVGGDRRLSLEDRDRRAGAFGEQRHRGREPSRQRAQRLGRSCTLGSSSSTRATPSRRSRRRRTTAGSACAIGLRKKARSASPMRRSASDMQMCPSVDASMCIADADVCIADAQVCIADAPMRTRRARVCI